MLHCIHSNNKDGDAGMISLHWNKRIVAEFAVMFAGLHGWCVKIPVLTQRGG